jgi:hypothetical protein
MPGSNGAIGGPGHFDENGKWVQDQYDHNTAPGQGSSPARGEGGLGSTAYSDYAYAMKQNGQTPASQPHQLLTIPNSDYNQAAAKRLYDEAYGANIGITATHAAAPTINRAESDAVKAQQMEMLERIAAASRGGGPSVANAMQQGAMDSAMRAQLAAGRGGGSLANRAVMGAGAGMHADNAAKFGAMRAGEQQNAWGSLANAAFGVRGADLSGDVDQARLNMQAAMANAGADQSVSLANQRAQQQQNQNILGAAGLNASLYQDAFGADLGYRRHLTEGERLARERRDRANARDQAIAAQGVGTLTNLMTVGMMNTGKPPAAKGA